MVIAIELDDKMVDILNDRFSLYDNFKLINKDVLKVDLEQLIKEEKESLKLKNLENNETKTINAKIVANLPYYITTPIVMKLLEEELDLESITVMIQKEVADRLIEIPGGKNTGSITYSVFYYTDSQSIMEVPNHSFIPEPEVTSKVIKLNIRKNKIVNPKDKKVMFKVIKCAFMQRRKTLLNALVNSNVFENKEEGRQILEKLDLDVNIRPEKLSLQNFADIADELKNI